MIVVTLAISAPANATPSSGTSLPPVTVEDTAGGRRTFPEPKRPPVLLIYEDQNAGAQNQRARDTVGKITDRPENQGRLELFAVADLEKWNWWPARKYALADLQKIAKKEDAVIYCDWKGAMRKAWGLQKGKSGFVLLGSDGKVRFAGEGPLGEAQIRELVAQLAALGLTTQ
jgi:hypothetical protein